MNTKLSQYLYTATGANGESIEGEASARSVAAAVESLEQQGLQVLSIRVSDASVSTDNSSVHNFHRKIESAIDLKSRWLPALEALTKELPAGVARAEADRLLRILKKDLTPQCILNGSDTAALLPLLTAGIDSSQGAEHLEKWLQHVVSQQCHKTQERRAFVYPLILLLVFFVVLFAVALFVIPVFRTMFDEFGLPLPPPTRSLFWIAEILTTFSLYRAATAVGAIVILSLSVVFIRKQALTNRILGRIVAGTASNVRAMSRFTSTLAESLTLDAPLPLALRTAGLACKHEHYRRSAFKLAEDNSGNVKLSESTAGRSLPRSLILAMQVGPESAPDVTLIRELSTIYAQRDSRVNWFASSLPSVAVLVLGLMIGFMVIALFMPLVSMITSLA